MLCCVCACSPGPLLAGEAAGQAPGSIVIRVGISVYDDSGVLNDAERLRYEQLFSQLQQSIAEQHGRQLDIQYRAAMYSEVVHWCQTDMVDLAVLSPGAYNELMQQSRDKWQYLCTMGQRKEDVAALRIVPTEDDYRFEYGLMCMVKKESKLLAATRNLKPRGDGDDPVFRALDAAYDAKQIALYFVDPISVSGGIAPLYLLRHYGAGALKTLSPGDVEYTDSHSRSLGIVAEMIPDNSSNFHSDKERVAFVWDGVEMGDTKDELAQLPLEMLRKMRIPESAVVVSKAFYQGDEGRNALMLDALHLRRMDFKRLENFEAKYGSIKRWRDHISGLQQEFDNVEDRYAYEPTPGYRRADWTSFFRQLDSYYAKHKQKPRIAVVFGGGGAKCAYQAGAMEVLERKLREDREKRREIHRKFHRGGESDICDGYDISLVVGTSGGALNALPVALGVSKTEEGMHSIQDKWQQLDGRDIIHPEWAIQCSVGGWLFICHLVLMLAVLRFKFWNHRFVSKEHRFRVAYIVLIVCGSVHLCSWLFNVKWPWFWLSWFDYSWYPVWILLASGVSVCGLLLLATGLGMWMYDRFLTEKQSHVIVSTRFVRESLMWVMLIFILVEIPVALFFSKHVSDDTQFERQVQRLFAQFARPRLEQKGYPLAKNATLGELSNAIFNAQILERDLIISATTLQGIDDTGGQKDVYFYARASSRLKDVVRAAEDPPAPQYHDLQKHSPRKLFDALIGSGTVFPVFPPRHFGPLIEGGHDITLVDGGFSHNNPVEAAVKWDATHIILIKPSQDLSHEEGQSLLANAGRAFNHLFEQAQAVDARAMSESRLFVLRPESKSHQIPLLCFARDPIQEVIRMAKQETESHSPFLEKFR